MQEGSRHDVEALGDVARQLAFTFGPQAALEAFDVLVKGTSGFSNPRMVRNIASIMRQFPIDGPARQGPHEFAELLEDTLIEAADPIDAELLLVVLNAGEFCASEHWSAHLLPSRTHPVRSSWPI
jgi:hypothetical protein